MFLLCNEIIRIYKLYMTSSEKRCKLMHFLCIINK